MKRVSTLLTRSLIGALLLRALTANVASADPGHGNHGAQPQLLQPEDPGTDDGGGYEGETQPEDPGVNP